MQPKLIIHGGAGSSLNEKGELEVVRKSLHQIVDKLYKLLLEDTTALDVVVYGCQLLEDNPIFNAGTGSVLQSDGQIRMSASLMDGLNHRFSGAINVSRIKNPIDLARALQESPDRVLSDNGAAEFVRELQMPVYDPLTNKRLNEWLEDRKQNFNRKMANVVTASPGTGTIGVVALDKEGRLAAGTSTGGKGLEKIGRVSDSATPAGNYATGSAAVSCTGIGEDIIDECLAAKIVIRVTDGFSIKAAFERSFAEAHEHKRDLGAIGIDASGTINWGKTCDVILAAFHDGHKIGDSLEADKGTLIFTAK
ncbi:MAG: isoaspartyl peptidase/L-asparaginase [Trichodesmium sp. MAG_R03]|nr:isoaspartyl peptidase/L-asparaginase [Trichodesmium sp. MAG_R03]